MWLRKAAVFAELRQYRNIPEIEGGGWVHGRGAKELRGVSGRGSVRGKVPEVAPVSSM